MKKENRFKFKDNVLVTRGFYKGLRGKVVGENLYFHLGTHYDVKTDTAGTVEVSIEHLVLDSSVDEVNALKNRIKELEAAMEKK